MSLPLTSVSQNASGPENTGARQPRRSRRWRVVLSLVVLALIAATAWLLLNKQQYGMAAGRPLSSPTLGFVPAQTAVTPGRSTRAISTRI